MGNENSELERLLGGRDTQPVKRTHEGYNPGNGGRRDNIPKPETKPKPNPKSSTKRV